MITQAAVTRSDLKRSTQTLLKNDLQFLATPASTTTDAIALKFFPDTVFSTHYPFIARLWF